MTLPAATPVLFVLPQHVLMLDLAGPAEVLRVASQLDVSEAGQAPPRFALSYAGPADSIVTSIGLPLTGLAPLPETLADHTMIVLVGVSSSADPVLRREIDASCEAVAAWLKRVMGPSHRLLCVCSGALVAARAGLLDGRRCTTHHSLCASLQDMAPRATVLENRLYVSDGPVSTSAGITAGIDMMLNMIAETNPRAAAAVARKMVIYMRRAGRRSPAVRLDHGPQSSASRPAPGPGRHRRRSHPRLGGGGIGADRLQQHTPPGQTVPRIHGRQSARPRAPAAGGAGPRKDHPVDPGYGKRRRPVRFQLGPPFAADLEQIPCDRAVGIAARGQRWRH